MMNPSSLVDKILPIRRAAARAINSISSQQLDDSPSPSPSPKGSTKIKYGGRRRRLSAPARTSTTPIAGKTPRTAHGTKRSSIIPNLGERGLSAHTVTGLPKTPDTTTTMTLPIQKSRSPALLIQDDSDSDLTPISSPLVPCAPSTPPATRPPPSRTETSTSIATTSSARDDPWELTTLGTYVWVLLDRGARVFEPADDNDDPPDTKQRIWWPGKLARPPAPSIHLEVQLYDSPGPHVRGVEIRHPCAENVLSMFDPHGRARFRVPTFVPPLPPLVQSPRKKRKMDQVLKERWEIAVAKLMRERAVEEDEQDELPEVGAAYDFLSLQRVTMNAPAAVDATPRSRGKRKRDDESDEDMQVDADIESTICVEEPDHNLSIPGELVLARDRWGKYWPARVLEFIAPARNTPAKNTGRRAKKQDWGYRVAYLDGTEAVIERTWFFNSDEDGFGTCKLGKWESEFAEVLNDMDIDDIPPPSPPRSLPFRRPSRPPSVPFPTLPLHTQFTYVEPILELVLTEHYPPVHARHLAYVRGGRGRKGVVDEAGLRGKMDPREVGLLERFVREWCLGERNGGHHSQSCAIDSVPVSPPVGMIDAKEPPHPGPDHVISEALRSLDIPLNAEACVIVADPPSSEQDTSALHAKEELEPARTESIINVDPADPPKEDVEVLPVTKDSPEEALITPSMNAPDGDTPIPPTSDHPQWCEAFEALAEVEKIDYCLNVLLPEAILQILLWREGERTSVHLLDEAGEAELHLKGEALVRQTDWVFDVMRLRAAKIRQLERHRQKDAISSRGSGSLRPRRSMKAIDYQE